jgi:hypothetical protein
MADIADVLNALAALVAAALYPDGAFDAQAHPLASTAGPIVKIMRGTPFAKQLDEDLRAGIVNVTVNERSDLGRTTTRFLLDWSTTSIQPSTLKATIAQNSVTFTGSVTTGQGIMLLVDGQPYAYQCQVGDTLSSVASALVGLISLDKPVASQAEVLSIPNARKITIREVTTGTSIRPVRQQTAALMVKVYAPSFSIRDAVGGAVDAVLATITRLALEDGSVAMLRYSGTSYDDRPQKALTFTRTLLYQAEYSTTQTRVDTTIGVVEAVISPHAIGGGPGPVFIATDDGAVTEPLPSDLNVLVQDGGVLVDAYGDPEVEL